MHSNLLCEYTVCLCATHGAQESVYTLCSEQKLIWSGKNDARWVSGRNVMDVYLKGLNEFGKVEIV